MLGKAANIVFHVRLLRYLFNNISVSVCRALLSTVWLRLRSSLKFKRFCGHMTQTLTDHEDGVISVKLSLKRLLWCVCCY